MLDFINTWADLTGLEANVQMTDLSTFPNDLVMLLILFNTENKPG